MTTVRDVHPCVLVGTRFLSGLPCVTRVRDPEPGDDEEIDALPVSEQAAIACAIHGSDRAGACIFWDMIDVSESAVRVAARAGLFMESSTSREYIADKWAEAEARIRSGRAP